MGDQHRYWDAYPTYERTADGTWVGEIAPLAAGTPQPPGIEPIRASGATKEEVREALNYQFLTRLYELPTADEQREFLRLYAIGSTRPKPAATAPPPYAVG